MGLQNGEFRKPRPPALLIGDNWRHPASVVTSSSGRRCASASNSEACSLHGVCVQERGGNHRSQPTVHRHGSPPIGRRVMSACRLLVGATSAPQRSGFFIAADLQMLQKNATTSQFPPVLILPGATSALKGDEHLDLPQLASGVRAALGSGTACCSV